MMRRLLLACLLCLLPAVVWALPANGVLDTFTNTDGTSLPTHNANWSNCVIFGSSAGTFSIQDNAITVTIAQETEACWATIFNANSEVYATSTTGGVEIDALNACLRLVNLGPNTTDGYCGGIDFDGDLVYIQRVDNGVETSISSVAKVTTHGDSIMLTANGSQLCSWLKTATGVWSLVACVNDTTYSAGGQIGVTQVTGHSAVGAIDDFGGGNLPTFQISRVQSKTNVANNVATTPAVISVSFDATPALGSFVTVAVAHGGGAHHDNPFTFSDNQAGGGNTYANDVEIRDTGAGAGNGIAIASAQITKASGTFTVSVSIPNGDGSAPRYMWVAIAEWSGVKQSGALDKTSEIDNAGGPGTTAPDTGTTAALSQPNELVIAAVLHGSGGAVSVVGQQAGTVPQSVWRVEYNHDGSVNQNGDVEAVVTSSTTGVRHVWLLGSSQAWIAVEATYRAASRSPRRPILLQ